MASGIHSYGITADNTTAYAVTDSNLTGYVSDVWGERVEATVYAAPDNAGYVAVGGPEITADTTDPKGILLAAGASYTPPGRFHLSDLYILGEGAGYTIGLNVALAD